MVPNICPSYLLGLAAQYNNTPQNMVFIKLGLLNEILTALNPAAPTDAASLIVLGSQYASFGPATYPGIELGLLALIAQNTGCTSTVSHAPGSPIDNHYPPNPGGIYINDTDKTIWTATGGVWTQQV